MESIESFGALKKHDLETPLTVIDFNFVNCDKLIFKAESPIGPIIVSIPCEPINTFAIKGILVVGPVLPCQLTLTTLRLEQNFLMF